MQATMQVELLPLARHNWPNSLHVEIKSEGSGKDDVDPHIRVLKASQHSQVRIPRSQSFPGTNLALQYVLKQEWDHFWRLFLSLRILGLKPWVCPGSPPESNLGRERTVGNSLLPLGDHPHKVTPLIRGWKAVVPSSATEEVRPKSHTSSPRAGWFLLRSFRQRGRQATNCHGLAPPSGKFVLLFSVCLLAFFPVPGAGLGCQQLITRQISGFTSPTPTLSASATLPWFPVRRGRHGEKGVSFTCSVLWPLLQAGFLLE